MNLVNIGGMIMLSGVAWLLGSFMGRWLFKKSDLLSYKIADSVLAGISIYFMVFTTHVIGGIMFMLGHMACARFRKVNQYTNLDVYIVFFGLAFVAVGYLLVALGLKPH